MTTYRMASVNSIAPPMKQADHKRLWDLGLTLPQQTLQRKIGVPSQLQSTLVPRRVQQRPEMVACLGRHMRTNLINIPMLMYLPNLDKHPLFLAVTTLHSPRNQTD